MATSVEIPSSPLDFVRQWRKIRQRKAGRGMCAEQPSEQMQRLTGYKKQLERPWQDRPLQGKWLVTVEKQELFFGQ